MKHLNDDLEKDLGCDGNHIKDPNVVGLSFCHDMIINKIPGMIVYKHVTNSAGFP